MGLLCNIICLAIYRDWFHFRTFQNFQGHKAELYSLYCLHAVRSQHLLTGTSVQPPAKGSMVTRTLMGWEEEWASASVCICSWLMCIHSLLNDCCPSHTFRARTELGFCPSIASRMGNGGRMEPYKAWFRVQVLYQQSGQSLPPAHLPPPQGQGGISSTWSVASMADLGQRWTVRNCNIGCTHCRAACESWQFRVSNTRSLFPVRRVSRCSLVSAAMVSKFDLKWHLCPPYALWLCRGLRTSTNNDYQQSKWSNTSLSVFLMLFWWAISRSVGEAISGFMVQW